MGKKRALLIDDDTTSLVVIGSMLKDLSFEVDEVENAYQALDLAKTEEYDVIIMDIQLPGMSGIEATQTIKRGDAGDKNKHTPVIALTAFGLEENRELFLASGMDDYLPKPVSTKSLTELLNRLFET